ncbi:MAG: MBL fold metallo-hydrolase [Conexibacter sp.]
MRLQLIRHATLVLELAGRRLLIDPMLADAGTLPPIEETPNQRPNPLVAMPVPAAELLDGLDGLLVTHLHHDHYDDAAGALLPRDLPLLCQPSDVGFLQSREGFLAALPVEDARDWEGIAVTRTGGRHGTGEIGDLMAPVSGFALAAPGEPVLLVAGDTVWCDELVAALDAHRPDVVVLNAGGARFLEGDPITMTAQDVVAVAEAVPQARLVVVHLEAINHCLLTRAELRAAVDSAGVGERVAIPADGEALDF